MTDLIKRYTSLANALDTLKNQRLTLLDPATWKDKNDTRFLDTYRRYVGYPKVYAACFTNSGETYHHWEVFARHNEGICIELYKDKFIDYLWNIGSNYIWGNVKYYNLTQIGRRGDIFYNELPFMKGDGFKPEQEFRLVYGDRSPKSVIHHLECPLEMVNRIIINPWIPHGLVPVIRDALLGAMGGRGPGKPRVEVSSLIDNEQWASAVNNVYDFDKVVAHEARMQAAELKPSSPA